MVFNQLFSTYTCTCVLDLVECPLHPQYVISSNQPKLAKREERRKKTMRIAHPIHPNGFGSDRKIRNKSEMHAFAKSVK